MNYGIAYKATGSLVYMDDSLELCKTMAEAINASSSVFEAEQVHVVKVQYLMLCAWCKPLNDLHGSHGCCQTHKLEVLKEIADMRELVSVGAAKPELSDEDLQWKADAAYGEYLDDMDTGV